MDPYVELRVLRTRREWSQQDLADLMGVSAVTVIRWEHPGGMSGLKPRHVLKMAELLKVSPVDLLKGIVNYKPREDQDNAVHS